MKAVRVYYEKCFNLGNYENAKIGIEMEVEEGEHVNQVIEDTRLIIEGHNPNEVDKEPEHITRARKIIANPSNQIYSVVKECEQMIAEYDFKENF